MLREHLNEAWHICTGDGTEGGLQDDGAWLQTTFGERDMETAFGKKKSLF